MSLQDLRDKYAHGRADALQVRGVNHVAFVTHDMARTIWFWCEVLGMKLVKTLQLPDEGQHFFIEAGPSCCIAYFYFPNAPKRAPGTASVDVDEMLRGIGYATAHGSVNHVAFNVPADKLREYRRRLKAANVGYVSPILYHSDADASGYTEKPDETTIFSSLYAVDPSGAYIEFCAQVERPFTPDRDVNHVPARP